MSLIKANAKIANIEKRVLPWGKRDKLQLLDPVTREVLADVKLWYWRQLSPLSETAPTFEFNFAQDTSTADIIPTALIAFNGRVHDVVVRDRPNSVKGIEWVFKTNPTNEFVEE